MTNLTAKELTAIEDQLGLEQTLIKKYDMLADMVTDPQLKTKLSQISKKHRQHCNVLLGHLK